MKQRYEVLDVLGSGAMATVWRARDTELGRFVAIKRPHPAPVGSEVQDRFQREARVAATVSHPNLVTVYDVGVDADGPYLVMELVEAGSLAETEWTPALARSVGADIGSALAALHAAGIVHRDVKPANILVASSGALLADFGIARGGDDPTLTREGTTFATPAYAAPEVLAHGEHSPASDVYALAAVLREMILGHRPQPVAGTQILITDELWRPVLDQALDERPHERPSATAFADSVSALPGTAMPSTTVLPVATSPASPAAAASVARAWGNVEAGQSAAPESRAGRPGVWAVAVLAVLGLIVAMVAVAGRQGESEGDTDALQTVTGESAAQDADTETVAPSVPTTLAPTTLVPTTEPVAAAQPTEPAPATPSVRDIDTQRAGFVEFVDALPEDVIKAKEREKLIGNVDEAIEAGDENDDDRASKAVEEALKRIDKQIEDDGVRANARTLVQQIASTLGVAVDPDR